MRRLPALPRAGTLSEEFTHLGGHVASVLQAAQQAAEATRDEARGQVEALRRRAEKEVQERTQAARRDADALRGEAERTRAEAEEWAAQTRQAAEAFGAATRAEAENEARQIIAEAEQRAADTAEAATRRQHELNVDIELAEERLAALSDALRELAARLDALVEGGRGDDRDLDEMLRQRAEAAGEAAYTSDE